MQFGRDFSKENLNLDYSDYDFISIELGQSHARERGSLYTLNDLSFEENVHGTMLKKAIQLEKIPMFYSNIVKSSFDYLMHNTHKDMTSFYLREYRRTIVLLYEEYSSHIAKHLGEYGYCVFLVEPHLYEFTAKSRRDLTGEEIASLFDSIVSTIKAKLPHAHISFYLKSGKKSKLP